MNKRALLFDTVWVSGSDKSAVWRNNTYEKRLSHKIEEFFENVMQSQNHKMLGVGRGLCGSPSPTPLPKQGQYLHRFYDVTLYLTVYNGSSTICWKNYQKATYQMWHTVF